MNLSEYQSTVRHITDQHRDTVAKANEVLKIELAKVTAEYLGDHEDMPVTAAEAEDSRLARRMHGG